MQLAMNFWGWGRKRENFWPVEDKDYMNNMLVPRKNTLSTCEGEFLSLQNKVFLLMLFSMEEKSRENWCRKKEELYVWICAGLAGGTPVILAPLAPAPRWGGGWSLFPVFQWPPKGTDFWSWWWSVCLLLELREWKKGCQQVADVRVHLPFRLHLPFSQMRTHCVFVVNCVSQPSFWLIYLWIRYLYKRSCSCSRNVGAKVQRQSTAKLPGNPVTRDGLISSVASVQATCCSLCSKYHWCAAPVEELWGGSSVEPPLQTWHKLFPNFFFLFFIY